MRNVTADAFEIITYMILTAKYASIYQVAILTFDDIDKYVPSDLFSNLEINSNLMNLWCTHRENSFLYWADFI